MQAIERRDLRFAIGCWRLISVQQKGSFDSPNTWPLEEIALSNYQARRLLYEIAEIIDDLIMKAIIAFITIVILAGLKIQADESSTPARSAFKPTWKGDDHDPPVYTSPTNGLPAVRHPTNLVTVPAITNWHATNLPPMTNWPATNQLPALTNPPVSHPPGGE